MRSDNDSGVSGDLLRRVAILLLGLVIIFGGDGATIGTGIELPSLDWITSWIPGGGENVFAGNSGYHVMMMTKESDTLALPEKTKQILNSTRLREYWRAKTTPRPEGTPGYRCWDVGVKPVKEDPMWTTALGTCRTKGYKPPYVAAGTGSRGAVHEITRDDTEDTILDFCKRYGGQ